MTNYTFENLEKLIRAKVTNRLVILAGAGVSMNSDIPSWDKLVNRLAQKIDLEDSKLDSLKKVQLYLNKRKHRD
jgi:NAD-dependent SIR2 family protein deacetylase